MKRHLALAFLLFVLTAVPFAAFGQEQKAATSLETITTAQYDKMNKNNQIFVVVFGGSFCGPCRTAVEKLSPWLNDKFGKMENVHVYYMDVMETSVEKKNLLHNRLGVGRVPFFAVLSNNSLQWSESSFNKENYFSLQDRILGAVKKLGPISK